MELHQLSRDTFRLSAGSELYLAIATAIHDESIDNNLSHAGVNYQGRVVCGEEVALWPHCTFCIDETVHVIGPYIAGTTLAERLEQNTISIGHISRLARALTTLKEQGVEIGIMHTQAILLLENGGVLFLAEEIISLLRNNQIPHEHDWNYRPFNHPKCHKYHYNYEDRYSFTLAALTYFALCGRQPWDIENHTEITKHIMSGILPNLHFYDPSIRPEIVSDIQTILGQPKLHPPPLKFWKNFFLTHMTQGTHMPINDKEARLRTRKAYASLTHLQQSHARRNRIRYHSFRLFGALIFMLIIGIVPYMLTRIAIEQPRYRARSAEEVVHAYYDGLEQLNRKQVISTTEPNYTPPAIAQLENIYRTSRIGMIFRFQNPYLTPELWIMSGKENLGKRYAIYGIDNLSLTETNRTTNSARIVATYRYWLPLQFPSPNPHVKSGNSAVTLRKEEITLLKQDNQWFITDINAFNTVHE